MGKKRAEEQIARYESDGFPFPVAAHGGSRISPGRRFSFAIGLVSIAIGLAACAASDTSSDDNRRGEFYGSVSTGMSHP